MPKIYKIKQYFQSQFHNLETTSETGELIYADNRSKTSEPLSLTKFDQDDIDVPGPLILNSNDDQQISCSTSSGKGPIKTQAERKIYSQLPPISTIITNRSPTQIFKHNNEINEPHFTNVNNENQSKKVDSDDDKKDLKPFRCSVIKRAPQAPKSGKDEDVETTSNMAKVIIPDFTDPITQQPEQEQPIDYHVPKRELDGDENNDEIDDYDTAEMEEHKQLVMANELKRKATIYYFNKDKQQVFIVPGILKSATGHHRNNSAGSNNSGSGTGGNSSGGSGGQQGSGNYVSGGGGSMNSCGSGGGSLGGGGLPGGSGDGNNGGGGKDNRQHYGPSSPPTGSLPPFYETLKNSLSNGNLNGAYSSAYSTYNMLMPVMSLNHDDTDDQQAQQLEEMYLNGNSNSTNNVNNNNNQNPQQNRQYSLLQNANCNFNLQLQLKEEIDTFHEEEVTATNYENAVNLLTSGTYGNYTEDDANAVAAAAMLVDPMQITATLTLSNTAENALLESLSNDSGDLTAFLQRLPSNDNDDESEAKFNVLETATNGSNASTVGGIIFENSDGTVSYIQPNQLGKIYLQQLDSPPQYTQLSNNLAFEMGTNPMPAISSPQIPKSVNNNSSTTTNPLAITIPSPSDSTNPSPPLHESINSPMSSASTNSGIARRHSPCSTNSNDSSTVLQQNQRIDVIQQRLGLPSQVQLEFVNGGHGIKNPLANPENAHSGHGSTGTRSSRGKHSATTNNTSTASDGNLVCHVCNKKFQLGRLLNRHMKCHSDHKRYLCTFCGKGFNDTFDLKRHTRTHTGVRPYKCNYCEKSFTQRCSLESHCLKVHGVQHQYAYKERRAKMYVCEECGNTTSEPEVHYLHLKEKHPYSPALLKFYDKRHFKFTNTNFTKIDVVNV